MLSGISQLEKRKKVLLSQVALRHENQVCYLSRIRIM